MKWIKKKILMTIHPSKMSAELTSVRYDSPENYLLFNIWTTFLHLINWQLCTCTIIYNLA